ncbi:hypothetical protein INN71_13115 [Nocardioides sp. ChNu-153]|uniref:hypothetical protein n=1 Tax=unclassified Nocardioides TaxID=2615069 RepID=UPI002406D9A0|nr:MULTISPECIES: hypothetical protein [unclassified Nocardioides]MDF9715060.1 hypothetical protein [Nocardioides sp. ChNu-99]MDN7122329.1 hypothetical protein [Nocardioides sp. ChNu-153]
MSARNGIRAAALAGVLALGLGACSGDDGGEPEAERTDWPENITEACPEVAGFVASQELDEGTTDYAGIASGLRDLVEHGDDEMDATLTPLADAAQAMADSPALAADEEIADAATDPANIPTDLDPGETATYTLPGLPTEAELAEIEQLEGDFFAALSTVSTTCTEAGEPLVDEDEVEQQLQDLEEMDGSTVPPTEG